MYKVIQIKQFDGRVTMLLELILLAELAAIQPNCETTNEGVVCSLIQAQTNGAIVPTVAQQQLGLIHLPGCSGTLINRFWVITADHCLTTNMAPGGPLKPFGSLIVTADWAQPGYSAEPTAVYRQLENDLSLLYLGEKDLGPANLQLIYHGEPEIGMRMLNLGQGYFEFAHAGSPPLIPATQAQSDNQYRGTIFPISSLTPATYTFAFAPGEPTGMGGDSGGPDFVLSADGVPLGILGIHSTCRFTGRLEEYVVPGDPDIWKWVTGISDCTSQSAQNVRSLIIELSRVGSEPCRTQSVSCGIQEIFSLIVN